VAAAILAGTVGYLTWPRTPSSVAATSEGAARAGEEAADSDFAGRPAIAVLVFDNRSAVTTKGSIWHGGRSPRNRSIPRAMHTLP